MRLKVPSKSLTTSSGRRSRYFAVDSTAARTLTGSLIEPMTLFLVGRAIPME